MSQSPRRAALRPAFILQPGALAAALLCAALPATQVQAQEGAQRIEVTGTSIKRLEGEAALPVQILRREDIEKAGVTTAAELLKTLSANTAPLSDGASITDGTSGQRGFNGANLRGLGVSSTLVLLNGRRLANFASPGDNAGVDLNNIPAGAIQRVEVLKDGASAIYGTDAIGGVINFITRKDYRGVDVGVSALGTQEGGAGKRTATISAGFGDLMTDRFNVMGVLDVQQLDALRSSQRQFILDRPLASTLPSLMSSNPYPANIRIRSSTQFAALKAAGLLPADAVYSSGILVNPSAPDCNPPSSVNAPQSRGGLYGCSYDYMRDTEIYPASDKLSALGRATLHLAPDHQLFAEVLINRSDSTYRLSPNPQRVSSLPVSVLPQAWRDALSPVTSTVNRLQLRTAEAGGRTNEVRSDATRLVLGATGVYAGWDYDVALMRAENRATDKYVDGYVLYDKLVEGLLDGRINAFGPSGEAGQSYINSIKVNDEARKSRGLSESLDAKISRGLFAMPGGEAAVAIGGEFRRETTAFNPSALLLTNNIAGDRDSSLLPGEVDPSLQATRDSRKVASMFGEFNAPFSKTLEGQFALRYDKYSAVGDTINPKAGLRWQPSKEWLVRASAGTGFRAPSLSDLNRPKTYGSASSFLTDPQCVAQEGDIDLCTDQWRVTRESNPNLKPEKSTQFSLGTVLQPAPGWVLSLDWWRIDKKDVISTLGEQIIVESPEKYNGTYIERDADGFISNIRLRKENQGRLKTSGVDLGIDWRGDRTELGRFGVSLNGTLVLEYERQFGPLEAYRSNLGTFLNDQVIQRWRHRVSVDWDQGPFGLTLSNQFSSGYTDQNTAYDQVTNALLPARKVKPYSLWDLSGSWTVNKQLKVRGGIQNLFDTAPPFSNQAYYFLATYDPTYTDPRGRTFYASAQYSFR
ncbi:TonB-dependent receptor [Ideonella margarita]|uniref:TonB-dependent receptor n=1 Tax=Ideonella margarita TaxID=2984191 RepID=A0ABU9C3D5_9BURK